MKQIKVKWNRVNPADLSSTCCAQYFAFSKNDKIFLINEVMDECLFTKVIQASANIYQSIYDMDIWVGYVSEGMSNFDLDINTEVLMDIMEWTAKVQLQEVARRNTPMRAVRTRA